MNTIDRKNAPDNDRGIPGKLNALTIKIETNLDEVEAQLDRVIDKFQKVNQLIENRSKSGTDEKPITFIQDVVYHRIKQMSPCTLKDGEMFDMFLRLISEGVAAGIQKHEYERH